MSNPHLAVLRNTGEQMRRTADLVREVAGNAGVCDGQLRALLDVADEIAIAGDDLVSCAAHDFDAMAEIDGAGWIGLSDDEREALRHG